MTEQPKIPPERDISQHIRDLAKSAHPAIREAGAALQAVTDAFAAVRRRVEEAAQTTQADYSLAPPPPKEED